eukprot:gene4212-4106_t
MGGAPCGASHRDCCDGRDLDAEIQRVPYVAPPIDYQVVHVVPFIATRAGLPHAPWCEHEGIRLRLNVRIHNTLFGVNIGKQHILGVRGE